MDVEAALGDAVRRPAATDKRGTAHTLGPATSGHWCATCRAPTLLAADVLRIDADGCRTIAVFYHCEQCG
jgi:hypothetical protein